MSHTPLADKCKEAQEKVARAERLLKEAKAAAAEAYHNWRVSDEAHRWTVYEDIFQVAAAPLGHVNACPSRVKEVVRKWAKTNAPGKSLRAVSDRDGVGVRVAAEAL